MQTVLNPLLYQSVRLHKLHQIFYTKMENEKSTNARTHQSNDFNGIYILLIFYAKCNVVPNCCDSNEIKSNQTFQTNERIDTIHMCVCVCVL